MANDNYNPKIVPGHFTMLMMEIGYHRTSGSPTKPVDSIEYKRAKRDVQKAMRTSKKYGEARKKLLAEGYEWKEPGRRRKNRRQVNLINRTSLWPSSKALRKRGIKMIWNPVTHRYIQNTARNRRSILKQIYDEETNSLVLVSCSKNKVWDLDMENPRRALQGTAIPAERAYCSPLFEKSKDWANRRKMDWRVISAKHGIVNPGERISEYDVTLSDLNRQQKESWADMTADELLKEIDKKDYDRVIFLTGRAYMPKRLINKLPKSIEVKTPLEGKQIGERLQWFNEDKEGFRKTKFSGWGR